jgi:hypothetical protein
MEILDFGAIIVAAIAALGAWAAQRSTAKANKAGLVVSKRLDAEHGAYERARAFDIQTILRQDEEIEELKADNQALKDEMKLIKARLYKLEHLTIRGFDPSTKEEIDEYFQQHGYPS